VLRPDPAWIGRLIEKDRADHPTTRPTTQAVGNDHSAERRNDVQPPRRNQISD
jgi:hypothetical protein